MPIYEYRCQSLRGAVRGVLSTLDEAGAAVPEVRGEEGRAPVLADQHRVAAERRRLGPRRPQLGLARPLRRPPVRNTVIHDLGGGREGHLGMAQPELNERLRHLDRHRARVDHGYRQMLRHVVACLVHRRQPRQDHIGADDALRTGRGRRPPLLRADRARGRARDPAARRGLSAATTSASSTTASASGSACSRSTRAATGRPRPARGVHDRRLGAGCRALLNGSASRGCSSTAPRWAG